MKTSEIVVDLQDSGKMNDEILGLIEMVVLMVL